MKSKKQMQKCYRMSRTKEAIGTQLQGRGAPHVEQEVEDLLEKTRPEACLARPHCVFFSDSEDATKHGLTYDFGYLQLVEPVGQVEKRDNNWIGQLQVRHTKKHALEDLTIAHLPNEELAKKYWAGEPSNNPNWELVAGSATVTGYEYEGPVKVRKHHLDDALKAVAEYNPPASFLSIEEKTMQPTADDLHLLKNIYDAGQSVHVEGNVDHRPFKRLEDLGWIKGTALSLQDVSYKMTEEGLRRVLEVLD